MADTHQLLRIKGRRSMQIAAVLERAEQGRGPRPLVIIAPAYEHSIRNSVVIARHLLREGIDVLRYDACNHVGMSDGDILDFSLSSALEDMVDVVQFARAELAPASLSIVATSLAGRVAIRAAGQLGGEFACIASIACVMNFRTTLTAVLGYDVIGDWLAGRTRDPLRTFKVSKNLVRLAFVQIAEKDNWLTLESTFEDMAAARSTPFFDVHGDLDSWVSTRDVLALAERSPNVELVVLRGAVHELNAATAKTALRHLVRYVVKQVRGQELELDAIPELSWNELVTLNKKERALERIPIETWEPRQLGKSP